MGKWCGCCVCVCLGPKLWIERKRSQTLTRTRTNINTQTRRRIEKPKRNIRIRSNNEIERLQNTGWVRVCASVPVPLKLRADNNFTIDIMLCLEFPIQAFHQVNYFILFYFLCFLLGCCCSFGEEQGIVGKGFCVAKLAQAKSLIHNRCPLSPETIFRPLYSKNLKYFCKINWWSFFSMENSSIQAIQWKLNMCLW